MSLRWFVNYEYRRTYPQGMGLRKHGDWILAQAVMSTHPIDWLADRKEEYNKADKEVEDGDRIYALDNYEDIRLLWFCPISYEQFDRLEELLD